MEYNSDLYKEETIIRMISHFRELVVSILNDPQKKISELSILSKGQEFDAISVLNSNETIYPKHKTIVQIFEEQAAKTPEAVAVVFGGEELTYRQLDECSNQLANYLTDKGINPEDNVGLLSLRGLEMIIGIFGIIKTGAAYVPFNTEYPAERLQYIVENARIRHIVHTDPKLVNAFGLENYNCINLNESAAYPTKARRTNAGPDSPVYIMYTSGTTGRPKGITVSNRNIIKLVYEPADIAVNPKDRMLQWSNYAFDGCVYEIYSSLLKGASLYMIKDEWASDVYELGRVIKQQKITVCFITTALFNSFIDVDPEILLGLRKILFGGEKVSLSHVRRAIQVAGPGKIAHVYGPTETTVYATYCPLNHLREDGIIPIGKPLANTKLFVLDEDMHIVPPGVKGELYIGGDGVSSGYVNNDMLTDEKFVHILIGEKQERVYRTGDLVRWLTDGNIDYIGRVDNQVKIRGYRIEPGEIESVLQESHMVSKAVVTIREDREGTRSLVGYIVPTGMYDKAILISWLQNKLPDYMIPVLWVELDSFPLNPNGKIDKKALPDPDVMQLLSDVYVAPRNDTEEKLAAIWQDILDIEQTGIHDNFFELGGHSLLAIRLISAIRKKLETELTINYIFEYPTIAGLAEHLDAQRQTILLPPIEAANPRPAHIPLSFSQERLWFIDQLEGSLQYHVPAVMRLKGNLNIQALEFSIQMIVNRHEVLRTVIREEKGQGYQYIKNKDEWHLNIVDGSIFKEDIKNLQNYIRQLINKPFDLSKDYMIRVDLVSLDIQEYILVVTMHHIASDAWSMPIIIQEVAQLYRPFIEGHSINLEPLPLQYADFAIWQRKHLQGAALDKKIVYWKKKLDGVATLQLPTDYKRPAIREVRGASVNFMIDKELSDKLNQLSQQQGTTLFMTLLAIYKVLLHRYSGQADICVGISISNRPQQELEALIGFFVNTLALRTEIIETASFIELLQHVKTTTLGAYENQDVPFEKVVEEVVKERDPATTPLFQVMLVLLNTPESARLGLGEIELSHETFGIEISKFDITFHVSQSEYGLPVTIVYNTDLFRQDTIKRMAGHFKQLLNSVINDPLQSVELLQMLTEAEEQQLLIEFN